MTKGHLELTPVDKLSEAIVKVMEYDTGDISVLHLLNSNYLKVVDLLKYLKEMNINIEITSERAFNKKLKEWLIDDDKSDSIKVLLNDLDNKNKLNYNSNYKIENNFSNKVLEKMDFKWPEIDKEFIKKIMRNL